MLALQPRVVMVVIITSTGGVSKMLVTFEDAVDPGLVAWAGEYLNERLVGIGLGARMLASAPDRPRACRRTELAFLARLAPAFGEIDPEGEDALYVEGTAHLFSTGMIEDTAQINELMSMLERRVALLRVLRTALGRAGRVRADRPRERDPGDALARAGRDRLRRARRKLGAVSVIGPVRMDYAEAIVTVRKAAHELSRFVEDAYAGELIARLRRA